MYELQGPCARPARFRIDDFRSDYIARSSARNEHDAPGLLATNSVSTSGDAIHP
jgi:hypothetical protein